MCGIAGVFGKNDLATVESMLDRLIHRGPDDGYAVSGTNYALGARRLSIVGVADGRQPLSNENGRVWAAQNGELYNYPSKKLELIAKGHKLHTGCDTEMLPHLYEEYGSDLVQHIDGMFAVAIWDEERQIGVLARDRMGKKPLYYYEDNGSIYFASEIKSLLCVPGFNRRINLQALNYFLSFKHVPCPLTIFEGIHVLPPAHVLLFQSGKSIELRRYWHINWSVSDELSNLSQDDLADMLLDRLRKGVEKRLMSDVPIGFFLSGGIDSSLSTALAAEISANKIKTFTLTYGDSSTTAGKEEDRKWARFTAQKYATEHHEENVEFADFPENLRKIIACFDEPFAGTISTYFLASLIAKHVKVALSGDGADELFGSYLSHRLATPLSNYPRFLKSGDLDLIKPFQSQIDLLKRLYEPNDWQWRAKLWVYEEDEKRQLLSADIYAALQGASALERTREDFSGLTATDPLNRVLEAEYKTIFPDQVLAFVDRLSMAHSLEIRSAYLDTDLVEFATRLPGHLKIKNGETKYLLKKAALKYFPKEMVFRQKEGFLMPITNWLQKDLESYVRDTLSPKRLSKHQLFNPATVQHLLDELYNSECDYRHVNKVFSLVVFQEWFELYMDHAGALQTGSGRIACSSTAIPCS